MRATGCADTACCTGTGDTGLMKTMPLCCRASGPGSGLARVLARSGVCGAAKVFPGLEPEIRPRFCRVKLRMAGLGLCSWWACWVEHGESAVAEAVAAGL